MGYMGFGLNKWVYKQRPHKFFSKERKPIADTLPKHESGSIFNSDTPQLRGRLKEHKSAEELKEQRFVQLTNKVYRIIIYIAALITSVYIAVNYHANRESREAAAKARFEKLKAREKNEMSKSRQMYYEYAQYHIKNGDYKRAVSEFRSLVDLTPTDTKAIEAYANALYLFCINDTMECEQALVQYQRLIKRNFKPDYQQRMSNIYIHLNQFEKADSILNNLR